MSEATPMGGTELMLARLKQALPELTDQVQIICSRPLETPLENKPRVLWLHDLPQDPAIQCLRDRSYRTNFSKLVFVSHWQQQMFNMFLGVPYSEGIVIKNAIPRLSPDWSKDKPFTRCTLDEQQCMEECHGKHERNLPLKFYYSSTPHRGLAILAAAAEELAKHRQDWELNVFSSFKLYAWPGADDQFKPVYEQLEKNPCVKYHGTVSNETVRQTALDSHVWVYPSVYLETSCLCAIEGLMAGCLGITTNYGALPETCGEWAWLMQFSEDPNILVQQTINAMNHALDTYDKSGIRDVLRVQSQYYQQYYSWEGRVHAWKGLLEAVAQTGTPEEMFVVE